MTTDLIATGDTCMNAILLLLRATLSGVLLLAGYAKLRDRSATAKALAAFGVPERFASILGAALGSCEVAVCVGLLFDAAAWQSAVAAMVLFALFTVAITFQIAKGRRPSCHCFGQLRSAPIGPATIVRNILLLLMASLIVTFRRRESTHLVDLGQIWFAPLMPVCGIVSCGLLALVVGLLMRLLRQQDRILARLHNRAPTLDQDLPSSLKGGSELRIGAPAPTFRLPNLAGALITMDTLVAAGRPLLLVFVDPECGPCAALHDDLNTWTQHVPLSITLVSRGQRDRNLAKFGLGVTVLLQQDFEVAAEYRAIGTPSAIIVNPDGSIGSTIAIGADAIRALVEQIVGPVLPIRTGYVPQLSEMHHGVARPRIGDMSLDFELQDHSGVIHSLREFRGQQAVLLFWNPGCGYCQQLLPALRAWQGAPSGQGARLVFVSQSMTDRIMADELVDAHFRIGRWFGVTGTPSAVRLDSAGRVASQIAVGGPEILSLLTTSTDHARTAHSMREWRGGRASA
jgi:peroxiredoxin/uncharacterized membrane protein YphA (DoxX/SURF4 family)